MWNRLRQSTFINDLIITKGNAKVKILTEPLWNIPYNLYAPYATLFMLALGVTDQQVGLLLSLTMALKVFWSLVSGVISDKYGRRWSVFCADIVCWSIPTMIWAFSQNFWWFFAAAILCGFESISNNIGDCLFTEDAPRDRLVNLYTWASVTGLLAVFFTPVSMYFVAKFSLVSTMRVLYVITSLSMTAKFVLLLIFSRETQVGLAKMKENRGVSMWKMLGRYKGALHSLVHSRPTMTVLAIMLLVNITTMINSTFFSVLANKSLGVPEEFVAVFPLVRSAIMLVFIFTLQNRFNRIPFRAAMLTGIGLYLLANLALILASPQTGFLLIVYIFTEAFGFALLTPRKSSLVVLFVDPKERATICGLLTVFMIAGSTPFGWIAGALSGVNRVFPFILNFVIFAIGGIFVLTSKSISSVGKQMV